MQSMLEKRQLKVKAKTLQEYGVVLGEITPGHQAGRVLSCLARALLIFLGVAGTLFCTVTPFDLPFNMPLVFLSLAVMSLFVSFLYYNRITFYVGYLLLFVLITMTAFLLYWYINSGYQAFTNVVSAAYSDYFGLSSYREATEHITNRYITVTTTLCALGFILCIFLNIALGYMNLVVTFLLTFPLIQIPLYIGRVPNPIFGAFLLSLYITVGILSRSRHFKIPPYTQKKMTFLHIQKKKKMTHNYLASGFGVFTTTLVSILLSIVFLFVTNGLFYTDLGSKTETNIVKAKTDEFLKIFSQTGLSGFFNRYSSTGGLANGKLGGVSTVRPDYQYDLSITYVPYTYDTLYLRSYVGDTYAFDEFMHTLPEAYDASFSISQNDRESFTPNSSEDHSVVTHISPENTSDTSMSYKPAYAWMEIVNLDNAISAQFYPYDTLLSYANTANFTHPAKHYYEGILPLSLAESDALLSEYELTPTPSLHAIDDDLQAQEGDISTISFYTPYSFDTPAKDNLSLPAGYEDYVYENYLQVPEELTEALSDVIKEIGLTNHTRENNASSAREDILKNARLLDNYFLENFDYTMSPGVTPRNRDVVEYFLTTQKRGYCMHYAASSAVLLRMVGIPTRYVEGYVIKATDLEDATAVADAYDNWYFLENDLADTGLVNVRITDGNAHAWTEIYLDGHGWIPYEFTPPSTGDDLFTGGFSFFSLMSDLFRTTDNAMSNLTDNIGDVSTPSKRHQGLRFIRSMSFLLKPLAFIGLFVALLSVVLLNLHRIKLSLKNRQALRKQDYSTALRCSIMQYKWKLSHKGLLHNHAGLREMMHYYEEKLSSTEVSEKHTLSDSDIICLQDISAKALYSKNPISAAEYDTAIHILGNARFLSK
ncbi:MAG: transglutaminase domain-containing protein [Lachnospiraceae bacterium]|nr:transglutaminase domain-containing protein [Lachnospiraceae bacterium]